MELVAKEYCLTEGGCYLSLVFLPVTKTVQVCVLPLLASSCLKVKVKCRFCGAYSALQPYGWLYSRRWNSSFLHLQRRSAPSGARGEGRKLNIRILQAPRNLLQVLGSFTCPKVGTWGRLFNFPSDFYIWKIQRLRPGLNTRTREPEASMLTTRPLKPSAAS
jgi:hypothetical protein